MTRNFFLLISLLFILPAMGQENGFISTGNDFFRKGQFDQAERKYRQALNANPNNLVARSNLANALYKQKKYKDAINEYNQVVSASEGKTRAAAYYNAGVAYTRQNELEQCIEAFKNALRITPDDKQARENLQKALLELKKKQQAQSDQQKKQNPSSMSQSEAEKRLKQLEDKEKMLQQKLNQKQQGSGGKGKDW